jgi:hypothetical protein
MDINIESVSDRKEKVLEQLPKIIKKNERNKDIKLKPTKKKMLEAANIVRAYLKKHKRKIYGGMSIDESIKRKNIKKAIYDENTFPDYDFYTPEPINDIINICNELVKAGFKDVQGKEAFHANTYKIRVENYEKELADISYVWSYLYYKIPTIVIKDLHFVHPDFQIMDVYRIITNPMTGWLKIEKAYYRAMLLEKLYLLPKTKKFLKQELKICKCNYQIGLSKPIYIQKMISEVINVFLSKRKDYIIVGDYAYNKFIEKSKIQLKKKRMLVSQSKKYALRVYIFSQKYDNFIKEFIKFLKNDKSMKIKEISSQKYHPFLELYSNSIKIMVNNHTIIRIYKTDICQPYQKIDNLLYGSIHLQLLHYYSKSFRELITKEKSHHKKYFQFIISNLEYAREHYYQKNKKLGIEKNPYQELQIECMGDEINTPFQLFIKRKKTRKDFIYTPTETKMKKISDFEKTNHPNKSGNPHGSVEKLS